MINFSRSFMLQCPWAAPSQRSYGVVVVPKKYKSQLVSTLFQLAGYECPTFVHLTPAFSVVRCRAYDVKTEIILNRLLN